MPGGLQTNSRDDYSQLVHDGHYGSRPRGFLGRLDNVRRVWENQLTRFYLRPFLERLVIRCRSQGRGLRILDLGCGDGEGWSLLTGIPSLADEGRRTLQSRDLDCYQGVDLCDDMVAAARRRVNDPKVRFDQGDLTRPEPFLEPYDLYFSSFGSPSHLEDGQLSQLLQAIAGLAPSGAVVVLDLLGQFSLEWPSHWGYTRGQSERMQPYNMLWLYEAEHRDERASEFASYRLRFWGGEEVERFLRRVPGLDRRLGKLRLFDRSIFVGRHLDTGLFNHEARPTRRAVNGLFEFNHFTDPRELLVGPLPKLPESRMLAPYREIWNRLVALLDILCRPGWSECSLKPVLRGLELPDVLRQGVDSLITHARSSSWLSPGAPLANHLQPAFGLLLRQTEYHLQAGNGCGHGLLAILELS